MKILVAASALDLAQPLGCTPAWWQLLKALHECGAEVVATPYFGRAVESPWWRCYPNPCYRMGATFAGLRNVARKLSPWRAKSSGAGTMGSAQLALVRRLVTPRWQRHLSDILARENDFDAVLFLTIPLNHLTGVAASLRRRFPVPLVYFDGDLPASLPEFGGFASGFSIYEGANLADYDLLLSNSTGSLDELRRRGAPRAETLWWGADPGVFRPVATPQDIDVFFYGHGVEHREEWLRDMIAIPSQKLPHLRFVAAGGNLNADLGRAERMGAIPAAKINHWVSRARIQLNIARRPHATVYGSASTRLFELAAMRQCIVSNPLAGVEEWFEPGKEITIVASADEAVATIDSLMRNPPRRESLGAHAQERLLQSHTYRHRAERLLELLRGLRRTQGVG